MNKGVSNSGGIGGGGEVESIPAPRILMGMGFSPHSPPPPPGPTL